MPLFFPDLYAWIRFPKVWREDALKENDIWGDFCTKRDAGMWLIQALLYWGLLNKPQLESQLPSEALSYKTEFAIWLGSVY